MSQLTLPLPQRGVSAIDRLLHRDMLRQAVVNQTLDAVRIGGDVVAIAAPPHPDDDQSATFDLMKRWAQDKAGSKQMVLLNGEPGIGKPLLV